MSKTAFVKDLKNGRVVEVTQYAYDFHMKNKTMTVDRKVTARYELSTKEDFDAYNASTAAPSEEVISETGKDSQEGLNAGPAKTFPVKVEGAAGGGNNG